MPGIIEDSNSTGWSPEQWPDIQLTEAECIRRDIDYHERMVESDLNHINQILMEIEETREKIRQLKEQLRVVESQSSP